MKPGRSGLVCRSIASIFLLAVALAFLSCTSKPAPQPKAPPFEAVGHQSRREGWRAGRDHHLRG